VVKKPPFRLEKISTINFEYLNLEGRIGQEKIIFSRGGAPGSNILYSPLEDERASSISSNFS
jgi:hypothetical protein